MQMAMAKDFYVEYDWKRCEPNELQKCCSMKKFMFQKELT